MIGDPTTGAGQPLHPKKSLWQKVEDGCSCSSCTPDCSPDCTPDCTPDCGCDVPGCDLFLIGGLFALRTPGRAPLPRPSLPGRAGMALIRGYQRQLSPRLPTRCRHTPTCSRYGFIAVQRYGLVTGSRLTAGRLRRCTRGVPFGTADPVP